MRHSILHWVKVAEDAADANMEPPVAEECLDESEQAVGDTQIFKCGMYGVVKEAVEGTFSVQEKTG